MVTYRLGRQQRRKANTYLLGTCVGFGTIQLGADLLLGKPGAAIGPLGVFAALAVFIWLTARFSFTTLNKAGIRTRTSALLQQTCPWPQVADIDVRRNVFGTTVWVTRVDGTRFKLGAPVSGRILRDPKFAATVEQIRDAWHEHVPAGRLPYLTPREARTGRSVALPATAVVLWIFLPFMLLGTIRLAWESYGSTREHHVRAVVVGIDTSLGSPVYNLVPAPGFTFPKSDIALSPTEAFCAIMDSRTRIGDTVDLVYPSSDPGDLEDARVASTPEPEHEQETLEMAAWTVVLGMGAVFVRRRMTRPYRLRGR